MRRGFLLSFLALGSVFGFAAGVQSWRHDGEVGHGFFGSRRLDAVAEACVRAAERVRPNEAVSKEAATTAAAPAAPRASAPAP
jgi:hypothetical protein